MQKEKKKKVYYSKLELEIDAVETIQMRIIIKAHQYTVLYILYITERKKHNTNNY